MKSDVVLMYVLLLTLAEKGFNIDELLSSAEKTAYFDVIKINEISDELETAILVELFNNILVKAGIRFELKSNLVN